MIDTTSNESLCLLALLGAIPLIILYVKKTKDYRHFLLFCTAYSLFIMIQFLFFEIYVNNDKSIYMIAWSLYIYNKVLIIDLAFGVYIIILGLRSYSKQKLIKDVGLDRKFGDGK